MMREHQTPSEENIVLVGSKDVIKYVQAVQTQAQYNQEIIIKARGRNIGLAVDVSEIVTSKENKFLQGWHKELVITGTHKGNRGHDGDRVSFIEITIQKTIGEIDHETNKEEGSSILR